MGSVSNYDPFHVLVKYAVLESIKSHIKEAILILISLNIIKTENQTTTKAQWESNSFLSHEIKRGVKMFSCKFFYTLGLQ